DSARKHFCKEALALSMLNHPSIAIVHEFDTQQGIDFLVMEYVPGVTLSEKIADQALPKKEFTRLGCNWSRDRPQRTGNVSSKRSEPAQPASDPDGRLKILDFGL